MKRCRKVMDAAKDKQAGSESALIDLHSGTRAFFQYALLLVTCRLLEASSDR
jgi:hypothetical protein